MDAVTINQEITLKNLESLIKNFETAIGRLEVVRGCAHHAFHDILGEATIAICDNYWSLIKTRDHVKQGQYSLAIEALTDAQKGINVDFDLITFSDNLEPVLDAINTYLELEIRGYIAATKLSYLSKHPVAKEAWAYVMRAASLDKSNYLSVLPTVCELWDRAEKTLKEVYRYPGTNEEEYTYMEHMHTQLDDFCEIVYGFTKDLPKNGSLSSYHSAIEDLANRSVVEIYIDFMVIREESIFEIDGDIGARNDVGVITSHYTSVLPAIKLIYDAYHERVNRDKYKKEE